MRHEARDKALKSEAQECGELRKASSGRRANTAERVAKPCERGFQEAWQGFLDARPKV
jgi:hypothetical protein